MIGAISRKEFADGETLEVLLYDVLPTTPPPPLPHRTHSPNLQLLNS